ncbi:unnamed protein product, partial [Polarella glacialis]
MLTEVAHDLRELCHNPSGLHCRYLRFHPQGFHGKPAMRIGVYGAGVLENKSTVAEKCKDVQRIRYRIPVRLTDRNQRRHQRDFVSRRSYSPEFRSDYLISRRRRIRSQAVEVEARELMGRGRTLIRRQDSAAYDSDAAEGRDIAVEEEEAQEEKGEEEEETEQ